MRKFKGLLILFTTVFLLILALTIYGIYHARTYPDGGVASYFCSHRNCYACAVSHIRWLGVFFGIMAAVFVVGAAYAMMRERKIEALPKIRTEARVTKKGHCMATGQLNITFELDNGKRVHISSFPPNLLPAYNSVMEEDEVLLAYREGETENHLVSLKFLRKKGSTWRCPACGGSNHNRERCKYCRSAKPR